MSESIASLPQVDLDTIEIGPEVLARVPAELARQHRVIPVMIGPTVMILAMEDPMNIRAVDDLFFHCRLSIEPIRATRAALGRALAKYYP
ncbi:MAG: hypothetical protein JNK82_25175 [Myxococcaceae bacterium]|nr:hypothetical protein [Myxococcaceae bacterium]